MTMADVAQAAGVTAITVSRYLRQPTKVAADTAHLIDAALQSTGYLPNKQAGVLAGGRSRMVAALIPSIANSIFSETVQGLADTLQGSGHELMLAVTGYSTLREEQQLRALLGWSPAALVVTGRRHTAGTLALLRRARDGGTPVVEIWDHHRSTGAGGGFAQIGFDHARVGRAMAEHLLARGHRTLAYVDSGVVEDFRAHERGAGFAAAAQAVGVHAEVLIAPPIEAFDAGRQALALLLDAKRGRPRVRAAAFANDNLACGALLEAQARSVRVPQDLALLGFGDFALARQLAPGLSSVRPPRLEIGRAAGESLLRALREGTPAASLALGWELIERSSS